MSRLPSLVPPAVAGTFAVSLDGTTPGIPVWVEVDFGVPFLVPLAVSVTPASYAGPLSLGLRLPSGGRVRVASVGAAPLAGVGVRGPWHTLHAPAALRPPTLPPVVDPRSGAVQVLGAFPGAFVEVRQPTVGVIGSALADPTGRAAVVLTAAVLAQDDLQVRQELDGVWSAWSTPPVERLEVPFGQLEVGALFAGQAAVRVAGTVAGSRIDVTAAPSGVTGSAWATGEWPGTTEVTLSGPLRAGDALTVAQVYVGVGGAAGPGLSVAVPAAEAAPAPVVVGPVYAGATALRVAGVVPGMSVTVVATVDARGLEAVAGPAPVGFDGWLELPVALVSGANVHLDWALGSLGSGLLLAGASPVVAVEELPAELRTLTVMPGLFDCGLAVQVLSVPGAELAVTEDGGLVGYARVTSDLGNAGVSTVPLVPGRQVQAVETLPRAERSSDLVAVRVEAAPVQPRPMRPIGPGDPFVWVSAVNPGAVVWLVSADGVPLGWTVAADPVVKVPTLPVPNRPVLARSRLCDQGPLSLPVDPQADPGTPGPWAVVEQRLVLPPPIDAANPTTVEGQVYYPVSPATGLLDPNRIAPLVVMGHGQDPAPDQFLSDAYLGDDYLGRHLASHGMVVFSGQGTEFGFSEFLAAVDRLRSGAPIALADDQDLAPSVVGAPVALFGHSLGGHQALSAVFEDQVTGAMRGLAALVLISPNDTLEYVAVQGAARMPVLAITGTYDYAQVAGQRFLRVGYRPSVGVLFHRAAHNAFNRVWMDWLDANPDVEVEEHVIPDVEDPVRVRDATRELATS